MAEPQKALTQAQIKSQFHYDPDTGIFTRIATTSPRSARFVGLQTGYVHASGYVYVSFLGRPRRAHRLAWIYMTGDLPPADIDHINGDRADNRWTNLRAASRAQNNVNTDRRAIGASGIRGVVFDARYKLPWKACISIKNRSKVIGRFATKEAAAAARADFGRQLHGQFVRPG